MGRFRVSKSALPYTRCTKVRDSLSVSVDVRQSSNTPADRSLRSNWYWANSEKRVLFSKLMPKRTAILPLDIVGEIGHEISDFIENFLGFRPIERR